MRAVMMVRTNRFMIVVGLAACGGGDKPPGGAPDAPPGPDASTGCERPPAAADRTRHVVVSHPYDTAGDPAPVFEVLELSADGALTRPTPTRTFELGRASFGTIAFTPDGEIGLVALEDGKLGAFKLDASGTPTVIDAGFTGSFYASRVYVDPRGDRAYILDGNTRENGGGIYAIEIGCDGALVDKGMVAAAKLPGGLAFAGDRAIVAAGDVLDGSTAGHDVHLVAWGETPSLVGGVDAFGDDLAILGGSALTADGLHFLVGDTSGFSGVPNRVAIVGVSGTALTAAGKVEIEDPQAIATSPHGNVAVVTSAFGDAIFIVDDAGAGGAWRVRGQVTYAGARPQLPGDLATITRGALDGHVFISENVSVRHLAFSPDGNVMDLGSLAFGDGLQNISGAIGVTP